MSVSNWINLGLFTLTALSAILAWLRSGYAAKEASKAAALANDYAGKSANAAQQAASIQVEMLELQKREAQAVAHRHKKAALRATLEKPKYLFLRITNDGFAAATRLSVHIHPGSSSEEAFDLKQGCQFFTVDQDPAAVTLAPKSSIDFKAHFTGSKGFNPPFDVMIEWDDDSGERGSWKGTLT